MSKQKIKLEVEGLKMEPLKFFMNKLGKILKKKSCRKSTRCMKNMFHHKQGNLLIIS